MFTMVVECPTVSGSSKEVLDKIGAVKESNAVASGEENLATSHQKG